MGKEANIIVEDLDDHTNGQDPQPSPSLSFEQLEQMREQMLEKRGMECWNEIQVILDKYGMRLTPKVSIADGKIIENILLIMPK